MATRSRRQVSVISLQLAWLEEQRSSLAETVAAIDKVIESGQQWISQDVADTDFTRLCQSIEQVSELVVKKCTDILNEKCSPLLYVVENAPQLEPDSNGNKDLEFNVLQTVTGEIEYPKVSEQTENVVDISVLDLNNKTESKGIYMQLVDLEDKMCKVEIGQSQTYRATVELRSQSDSFESELDRNSSEIINSKTDDSTQKCCQDGHIINTTACFDIELSQKATTDAPVETISDLRESESINSKKVSLDLSAPGQVQNGIVRSESVGDTNQCFELQEVNTQGVSLNAGENQQSSDVKNPRHDEQAIEENDTLISYEKSVEDFYAFLINLLATSSSGTPIECLIKGADSVDGKFLDRFTERKSHDPVKDQLIRELTNRRLYHYTGRENLPEPTSKEIAPKGILKSAEAESLTGDGIRKKVTFIEKKSDDVKPVFGTFRKPTEEMSESSTSEFEDKGKTVTLLKVKHFSEFFDRKLEPSVRETKESTKSFASNAKYDLTTTKRLTPAFTACIPYGTHHTVTTGLTVTSFDDVISNVGNHFNPKTGEFTAPSSGVYITSVTLRQVGAGYVGVDVIKKSSVSQGRSEMRVSGAHTLGDSASATCFGVVELQVGDRVYLKGLQRGDAQLNMYSSFTCFMLA